MIEAHLSLGIAPQMGQTKSSDGSDLAISFFPSGVSWSRSLDAVVFNKCPKTRSK